MESRKLAIANFAKLEPKIADKIQPINEHPEMVELGKKIQGFEAELKQVENQLNNFYQGVLPPDEIHSPEADAQKLLSGDALSGDSVDTQKQNLRRRKDALTLAVNQLKSKRISLESKLIKDGCKELEPIAKKFVQATLDAFEQLEIALKQQEVFYQFLSFKGYTAGLRSGHWATTPREISLLYGGGAMVNFPSLAVYIDDRKKHWNLETKGLSRKAV